MAKGKLVAANDDTLSASPMAVNTIGGDRPTEDGKTNGVPGKPKSEDDIIWLAVSSLRNRARKLSPQGREKLFVMVKGYIG